QRVSAAATSALGLATDVVHELLNIGADVLRFAPVPGLELAAIALLKVWDALQLVDVNRTACVQLTERCATVLLSVRAEIAEAGDDVALELHIPLDRLVESFREVHRFLVKQANRPFIRRYLDRDEDERALEGCHGSLTDALGVFHVRPSVCSVFPSCLLGRGGERQVRALTGMHSRRRRYRSGSSSRSSCRSARGGRTRLLYSTPYAQDAG
ncbi:hypothetical protein C8Q76DRAFT_612908, partial [Earliella scabrosa]